MLVSLGRTLAVLAVLALLTVSAANGKDLAAQPVPPARLSGTVTDSASGAPLRATVSLAPTGRVARTDSAGRFAFADLAPGEVSVSTAAFGYRAARTVVRLPSGAATFIAVAMVPVARELEPVRTSAERTAEQVQAAAPAGPSVTSLGARELAVIPAVGETDVLRAASLLPGISARN